MMAWIEFHDHVEGQIADGLVEVCAFASKAAEHAARIAGILAMVENPEATEISLEHVCQGIVLAQYYLVETLRIHEAGSVSADILKADRLVQWMGENQERATGSNGAFKIRDIAQYGPKPRGKKEIESALRILEDHGYIVKSNSTARSSEWALT
jgi:hypothetical protein